MSYKSRLYLQTFISLSSEQIFPLAPQTTKVHEIFNKFWKAIEIVRAGRPEGGYLLSVIFVQIKDTSCQMKLLDELLEGDINIKEFTAECKAINKRRAKQKQFALEVGNLTWEEATRLYPLHTTAEAMDRYIGFNFKRILPEVWRAHVRSAKRFKEGVGMY